MDRRRFGLFLFFISHVGISLPKTVSETLPLRFESLFPDSPYKRVYSACVSLWEQLKMVKSGNISDEQWTEFHDTILDELIELDTHVRSMTRYPRLCSPDDFESLMEMVHYVHIEYVTAMQYQKNDSVVCSVVLFNRIKHKLEKTLTLTMLR